MIPSMFYETELADAVYQRGLVIDSQLPVSETDEILSISKGIGD